MKFNFQPILKYLNKANGDFLNKVLNLNHNPTPKSDLLPFSYYDETNKLFFNQPKGVGFILEATPIVGCDEGVIKQLALLFDDLLPENGYFQVLLIASHKIDNVINNWQEARIDATPVLQDIALMRGSFIANYGETSDSSFRLRNYRLVISYSEELNVISSRNILELKTFRERLVSLLSSVGIYSISFDANDLLNLLYEIINYDETPITETLKYNPHEELSKQTSFAGHNLCVDNNEILHSSGKYITRVYEVNKYPEDFSISLMAGLLGDPLKDNLQIPARFLISYTVSRNIAASRAETIKVKGKSVIKQADSFFARFNTKIKDEAKEWCAIEKRLNKGEKLITSSFTVSITDERNKINKTEQHLLTLYNANGWKLGKCSYFQLPVFLNMLPLIPASGLFRYLRNFGIAKTVLSSEPLAILPIHAEWKGHKNAGILLAGRKGQLFNWDPFEGESNYNACVIGQSGSGKSVFLQEFITTQLATGAKVFVLDIGRSFEKSCQLLEGDFIEFSADSKICLNPFSHIPVGNKTEEEDFLSLIKPIISRMAAPKLGTTDIEDSIIASAIKETWSKYLNKTDITKITQVLKGKNSTKEQDIASMLFQFTENGAYGRFFNENATISFTKPLTVIEFEELRERKDLLEVIMQMLSVQIMLQVFLSNRKQRFVILFDEAWLALSAFPEMLASLARTLRKYNGSLVLGTQSVNDFFLNKSAVSILENSAWLVMLKQKRESAEMLKKAGKLSLSDTQINLINSLETRPGEYSEILFSSSSGYFVGRLILEPFSRILYSTKPVEFNAVKTLVESGVEVNLAIKRVAEQVYG